MEEAEFPSRHLGLVSAFEAVHFAGRVHAVSKALQERGCVDAVLSLIYKCSFPGGFDCRTGECSESNRLFIVGPEKSESIQPFHAGQKKRIRSGSDHKMDPKDDKIDPKDDRVDLKDEAWENREKRCCIAVARDEAFSFFYQRSLENLERAGAQLCFFSPLRDPALPEAACGLYLPGGYPELHAAALEKNASMRASVREAVRNGLPTVAECGGFLYLGEELCDSGGHPYEMAGVFPGKASRQEKLVRFGYLELIPEDDSLLFQKGETVPAHEFHYWDSTCCGTDLIARKRSKNKTWRCGYATPGLYAAFPHLYLDQKKAERFVRACTNLS
jgi:cobyrinic acid a,c-diamide synthase